MIKKVIWVCGTLSTVAMLAAAGCSSSSDGATGGGGDSGTSADSGKKGKDGGLTGDGGPNTDGGGGRDGSVIDEDSGTITGIDGGGDGGPILLTDGGTLNAPACYDLGGASYFPDATAAVANQNKCSTTLIAGYYTACLDTGATPTTCSDFATTNAACATCIQGPSTAGTPFAFPVLVPVGTDSVEVSYEACYAALSTGTATCKANVPNEAMCVDNGCSTCTTDADACQDYGYADTTGCSSVAPVDTTCFNAVNTASMNTTNQTKCGGDAVDFQGFYTAVATTLCGP